MRKTQVFTVFSPVCTTHCAKDMEQDTLTQASMPFATMKSIGIWHKDVEQGKLSQASMPLATMPKTLVFTTFSVFYVLRIADSGLTRSISETETQCNKECILSCTDLSCILHIYILLMNVFTHT